MHVDAIDAVLLFTGFAVIAYGPWQTACTDYARQLLFEVRDELFDMANSGELSFQSNEYRTIRSAFESNIKYMHNLTLWRFLLVFIHCLRTQDATKTSALMNAINAIKNPDTKKRVLELHKRRVNVNFGMMLAKSPFCIVLIALIYVGWKIAQLFDAAKSRLMLLVGYAAESIQIEAEATCCPA